MKAINTTYDIGSKEPQIEFTNHSWFISFQISGEHPTPGISIYFDKPKDIVRLKNNFLSAYNKLIKELGYDR